MLPIHLRRFPARQKGYSRISSIKKKSPAPLPPHPRPRRRHRHPFGDFFWACPPRHRLRPPLPPPRLRLPPLRHLLLPLRHVTALQIPVDSLKIIWTDLHRPLRLASASCLQVIYSGTVTPGIEEFVTPASASSPIDFLLPTDAKSETMANESLHDFFIDSQTV